MNIQKEDNFWMVKPNDQSRDNYYASSYEKALYYAALNLVDDTIMYDSLKSFHNSLKMTLNKEYQGNLGEQIDFTGQWWFPNSAYIAKKQPKVKYLEVTT